MCSLFEIEDGDEDYYQGERLESQLPVKKLFVELLNEYVLENTFDQVSVWVCRGLELGLVWEYTNSTPRAGIIA